MRLICLLFVVNLTAQNVSSCETPTIEPSWYFDDDEKVPIPTRWMSALPDNILVSDLDIPGTHNSAALYEPIPATAKNQDFTIVQQLNMGVRYLDIRCRMIDNKFTIHHGIVYQNMNYDDVLTKCLKFLRDNPKETILMHVKQDHDIQNCTLSFQQIFANYVRAYPDLFFRGNHIPDLGEARGRIVLVRRFGWDNNVTPDIPVFGINVLPWGDNIPYQIWNTGCGEDTVYLQDCYRHTNSTCDKWDYVLNFHKNIVNKTSSRSLVLNYTSGTYVPLNFIPGIGGVISNPRGVAECVNPRVLEHVNNRMARFRKNGVLAMDFINHHIAWSIYKNNFWKNVEVNKDLGYLHIEKNCGGVTANTMESVVRVFRCPGLGSRFTLKDLEWLGYDNDSMNSFSSVGDLTYRFFEHDNFGGRFFDVSGNPLRYCFANTGDFFGMSSMQIPSPLYNYGGGLLWKSSSESLNDKELANVIKVYPNPSNGIFNIDFASKTDVSKIEVYDEKGSLILSKVDEAISNTIDIAKQPKGMYIVKIYTKNETIVKKIIRS